MQLKADKLPIQAFFDTAKRKGHHVALRHKVDERWNELTWNEYADNVRKAARALIALGVASEGTVAVIGPNRPEWLIGALGTMAAGGAPVGIYTTLLADQVAYIVSHAESRVAIVHDAKQLAKLRAERASMPKLEKIVLMLGNSEGDDVLSWKDFLALGEKVPESSVDERIAAIKPDETATMIYTSGTTGTPKAVMLTHTNAAFTCEQYLNVLQLDDEFMLSYLPLSHIAEQNLTLLGPCYYGGTIAFCEQLDRIGDYLREVRPTLFFAVPRVWEKIQAKITEAGAQNTGIKKKLGAWARGVGLEAGRARMEGRSLPWTYPIAKKLVFSQVAARLGLDRCKMCVSGAAAISKNTLEFFLSLDLPIYEVYGMSENTALCTLNVPGRHRLGTVGQPMTNIEVKIAEDGEILTRGKHVFKGYYKNEEATREAIDAEGWLHTGDVGEFDNDRFIRITDRKKELFKTAGGKYIAPQHLEGLLKSIPGVGQAVAVGDGRKYVAALLTLDPDSAPRIAGTLGLTGKDVAALAKEPAMQQHIENELKKINSGLARYETVKKFKILPQELSVDGGELTPTLKLKRKVISQKYAGEIDGLYADEASASE